MMSHYIVQVASANMPNSCWGIYNRVAVLEVHDGVTRASMISDRSRDVVRVVETWEALNVGKTERCAYRRALKQARAIAADMNVAPPSPTTPR